MATRKRSSRDPSHTERLAVLGEMTAEAAHEINNLLGAICAYAELERAQPGIHGTENIDNIMRITRLAGELMGNALRFAKPSASGDCGDVAEALKVVLGLYQHRTHRKFRILCEVPALLPSVHIATGNLQLILANLVKNAIDAIANQQDPLIRVTVQRAPTDVVIEVWNSGPALPPQLLRTLFRPFVSTKASGKGTGLGLAISRRLASSAGGELGVSNPAVGGVMFTLRIPVAPATTAMPDEQLAPAANAVLSFKGKRILVIDDEASVRTTLKMLIEQFGHAKQVATCASGDEALLVLQKRPFDAILLDLRMPGASGQEVFNRLPPDQQKKVVFVTGDIGRESTDFIAATRQPYLFKPFEHAHLLQAVQMVLNP